MQVVSLATTDVLGPRVGVESDLNGAVRMVNQLKALNSCSQPSPSPQLRRWVEVGV